MSSLAAEPRSLGPETTGALRGHGRARAPLAAYADPIATLLFAGLIVAVSFVARGGSVLSSITTTEIGVIVLGAAAVAYAALAAPAQRRLWGGITVVLFGALAAYTALSIVWSVDPADSWNEANLALAYFAAFAGAAALARTAPARWRALLGGIVLAAVVISAYSLLAKVYPSLSQSDLYARLRAPFDYWNAVGLMAALGVPGCLWLGARRNGHAALGALAVPALGLLLTTVILSVGRGAILALLLVVVLWFAAVPLRLRGAAVLAVAGAGAAVICAWTFANPALTTDGIPQNLQANAGHDLGLLLLAMVVVLLGAGLVLSFAMSRAIVPAVTRRRVGVVLLVLVALVPLAGIGALTASQRGLTGSISHTWHQLTDPNAAQPANTPGRLASTGSVRARYWDDAIHIWKRQRLTGVGADGYDTARRQLQTTQLRVSHAHGYVAQTLADLGLIGIGLNALVLLAWLVASGRAVGVPRPRWLRWPSLPWGGCDPAERPRPDEDATVVFPAVEAGAAGRSALSASAAATPAPDLSTSAAPTARAAAEAGASAAPAASDPSLGTSAERAGLITLGIVAIGFGFHSAIDWTWYVPGTAILACLAAGWLAGRGPFADPPAAAAPPRRWLASPTRVVLAATLVAAGLAAAWVVWQPLRAQNATNAANDALNANRFGQASADASHAVSINPLSIDALAVLAQAQQFQNQPAAARATLERAVHDQPANPEAWTNLGDLDLDQNDPSGALDAYNAALFLDPENPITQSDYQQAQQRLAGG